MMNFYHKSRFIATVREELTWANLISVSRVVMIIVALQYLREAPYILAVILIVGVLLDGLDGIVARKIDKRGKFGGMVDITADRTVEIVVLFTYAYWGILPYFFPIIFAVRGLATDSLRILNYKYKDSNFSSPLTMGGADNRTMRTISGLSKIAGFTTILIHQEVGLVFMTFALLVNLYRGIPVIFSRRSAELVKKLFT